MAKSKAKQTTDEDLELLRQLGLEVAPAEVAEYSPRQERILAGFEDIERFVAERGRLPQMGGDRDIFERLYAVRLDCLRASEECRALLADRDPLQLLSPTPILNAAPRQEPTPDLPASDLPTAAPGDTGLGDADLSDAELLASLGVEVAPEDDITRLTHVRSPQEIKAAEEVAHRTPCPDFAQFKPQFQQIKKDLKAGLRQTLKYQDNATIRQGDVFILDGHLTLVAEAGERFIADYGIPNARLRVIYDTGTESNLLTRSLQRALNRDPTSRRVTTPDLGPLFAQVPEATPADRPGATVADAPGAIAPTDHPTGYVYVLRSRSEDPFIAAHRDVVHKIGVTGGDVRKRIAKAKHDPTYLLAEVDIVATFQLVNLDRKKVEAILHRFFEAARLEVALADRFGVPVQPREWFLVPLAAIEAAIGHLQAGTLAHYEYDPPSGDLLPVSLDPD